jgi:hypothetical protein
MRMLFIALFLSFNLLSCSNNDGTTADGLNEDESVDNSTNDDEIGTSRNDPNETGTANGKLYLRTQTVSYPNSYLVINWIFLGDDGTIVYDPVNGVNPINYAVERENNAANVGNYKIEGDQLVVNLGDGKSTNQRIETRGGDISYIDGGIATRQRGVSAGFKLNGQYSGGAITKNLSSNHTYNFAEDGTFSLGRLGGVNTETEEGAVMSEDQRSGRYYIKGNTLTLEYKDGTREKAVIGIMNMGSGIQYLVINQTSFRMEK